MTRRTLQLQVQRMILQPVSEPRELLLLQVQQALQLVHPRDHVRRGVLALEAAAAGPGAGCSVC